MPDAFLAGAIAIVGDRATITHSSSFGLLEISVYGVTKATGLAELAESHGVAPTRCSPSATCRTTCRC